MQGSLSSSLRKRRKSLVGLQTPLSILQTTAYETQLQQCIRQNHRPLSIQNPKPSCWCTGHRPGWFTNHAEMQVLWNLQRHSSRAMPTPTANSSKHIVHSASSMQSFSVATYLYIPVIRAGGAGPAGSFLPDAGTRGLPYVLWLCMHALMCASRAASTLERSRDGNSRWQIGHSSSSAICGVGGSMRFREDEAALVNELCRAGYDDPG